MLRPIAGLLRMLQQVLRKRLLLLRVLWQHPGLLRKLLSQGCRGREKLDCQIELRPRANPPWAFFCHWPNDWEEIGAALAENLSILAVLPPISGAGKGA